MTQNSVLIAGTGAMASLFAARLSEVAEVSMLGTWEEGLEALRQDGVRVIEADGSDESYSVRAFSDVEDCRGAQYALVLVKSWQTTRVAHQLAACLSPEGVALTLQNGIGNLEILQDVLGSDRAAIGVTTMGATLLGPGEVRAGGVGPTHIAAHPRLDPLIDLLKRSGFEVHETEDLDSVVWGKLVVNAAINPLTALLGVPNGELLEHSAARELMGAAAEEAAAVASARGVQLPYEDARGLAEDVARRTATNRSSMLQDVTRDAPTEIDAISGAIAQEGERLGVPVGVNWTLWKLIRAKVPSAAEEGA
jgi:2-dehydropantoate 2-reductase